MVETLCLSIHFEANKLRTRKISYEKALTRSQAWRRAMNISVTKIGQKRMSIPDVIENWKLCYLKNDHHVKFSTLQISLMSFPSITVIWPNYKVVYWFRWQCYVVGDVFVQNRKVNIFFTHITNIISNIDPDNFTIKVYDKSLVLCVGDIFVVTNKMNVVSNGQ